MKDIREYPFLNWLYNYLEDNKYFKDNDVANEMENEIYKIFRENKYDFDTMLELEGKGISLQWLFVGIHNCCKYS